MSKMEEAYRNGTIDEGMLIRYKLYSLFDRSRLPAEYRSDIPNKSGTSALDDILMYISRRNADRSIVDEARGLLASFIPRLDRVHTSAGGFFNIHYTLEGKNAVPSSRRYGFARRNADDVPAYIRQIASAFDNSITSVCANRGFRRPVTGTGSSAIDVYVFDQNGRYGLTYPLVRYSNGQYPQTASCCICIDNDYSSSKGFVKHRDDCMRVTAAHEFFHSVQYAYDVGMDSWWKEASAAWNEDEVYTGVNDYVRYIGGYFSSPQKPLEESSYGGVVFVKYLSEKLGGYGIIKRIFELRAVQGGSCIDAIDRAIREYAPNEDMGSVFNNFTACNYNPSQYYKQGSQWNDPVYIADIHDRYPVSESVYKLDHLACRYHLFKPPAAYGTGPLKIVIYGMDRSKWGFKVQMERAADGLCDMVPIFPEGRYGRCEVPLAGLGTKYDGICLIPANLEKIRNNMPYAFSVI